MFGWGSIFKIPRKSKSYPNGCCEEPVYGIQVHDNTIWLRWGKKKDLDSRTKYGTPMIDRYKTFDIPFTYSVPACRHQVECEAYPSYCTCMIDKDRMECKDHKNWVPIQKVGAVELDGNWYRLKLYNYNYIDKFDGAKVPCTFWVEEYEWRPKWLGWCGLFKSVRRYIEIYFDDEVGKEKDSWKGGCTGCSYELKPGESPEECIKRMEHERTF